jgi:hypothetical protein
MDMDYSIDLSVRVGTAAADPALGVRLIRALEPTAPDAAIGQDTAAGTVGAAFTIDAPDAGAALEEARRIFDAALEQLGVSRSELVELHVAEAAVASG